MDKGICCFFGIDGAGKSTLIREVQKRLEEEGIETEKMYMGRSKNHKIPFISWKVKLKEKLVAKKEGKDPEKVKKPLVNIYRKRGWIWMSVYFLDLWLRYLEVKIKSREKIVLMDRYFFHGLLLTRGLKRKFFEKLIPKPSKSFLINAPPEIILGRKDEASEENIRDFYNEARKLSNRFKIEEINNSKELEVVVDEITEKIKNT